jgi:hypothetical protein
MRSTRRESLQEEADDTIELRYGTAEQPRLSTSRTAIAKTFENFMVAFDILISDALKVGRYLSPNDQCEQSRQI